MKLKISSPALCRILYNANIFLQNFIYSGKEFLVPLSPVSICVLKEQNHFYYFKPEIE